MSDRSRSASPVVIVTPDFTGPRRNGGIGSATFWQARELARAGYDVEVLFSGVMEVGTSRSWNSRFVAAHGFRFVDLRTWARKACPQESALRFSPDSESIRAAQLVLQYVTSKPVAAVYLQDYLGHGLRVLQYKKAGLGLADVPCAVTLHSSQQWIREGMQVMPTSFNDLVLDFQERESAELADRVISPSRHMADWAASRWGLSSRRIDVVPYCFEEPAAALAQVRHEGFDHLIFFGRLETRKGLHFLLDALRTSALLRSRIRRVTFLGSHSQVNGRPSAAAIAAAMKGTEYKWTVIDNKDANAAWEWLSEQRRSLVVAPSTLDNLPYSVLELYVRRLPFVSTTTGGIPEIVGPRNRHLLAEPTSGSVRACLERHVSAGFLSIDYSEGYAPRQANRAALAFHERRMQPKPVIAPKRRALRTTAPVISVVVPHYNCSDYLRRALDTLRQQTLKARYEVIVVDDQSPDPEEKQRFLDMGADFDSRLFHFVEAPENGGPSGARNFGSRFARGRYLVFFDADNEAEPHMLEHMLRGIEASGFDSMSCFNLVIAQPDRAAPRPLDRRKAIYINASLGSCLETAMFFNTFGDACSIYKRSVFEALGGFTKQRGPSEDWEFFTMLVTSGYKHGMIPEILFLYREQGDSHSRAISLFENRMRALPAYGTPGARAKVDWVRLCSALSAMADQPAFSANVGSLDAVYHFFAGFPDRQLRSYLELDPRRGKGSDYFQTIVQMRHRVGMLAPLWDRENPRIYIYGTGLHTKVLLGTCPELARWVAGFIDQRPRKSFLGLPCVVPDQFRPEMADVVLYSSKAAEKQMHANLAHLPVQHVLIYAQEEKR